jgi:hypothetical protein
MLAIFFPTYPSTFFIEKVSHVDVTQHIGCKNQRPKTLLFLATCMKAFAFTNNNLKHLDFLELLISSFYICAHLHVCF